VRLPGRSATGADVTLGTLTPVSGPEDITGTTGNDRVVVAPLDLTDQASVAAFVANWDGPLHILVNNAGIMASPEMRTPQGWEMQFATNHLGHFALATGLHPALAAAGGARIVSVSSAAHLRSPVVFDDIHFGGGRTTHGRRTAVQDGERLAVEATTRCDAGIPPTR
jgi:NAD(P)-dependent dehydrogenase (short-subunit alcohol dehydrogenase family)